MLLKQDLTVGLQDAYELMALILPLHSKFWDYGQVPPCVASDRSRWEEMIPCDIQDLF